jgi:hypothetical protein
LYINGLFNEETLITDAHIWEEKSEEKRENMGKKKKERTKIKEIAGQKKKSTIYPKSWFKKGLQGCVNSLYECISVRVAAGKFIFSL